MRTYRLLLRSVLATAVLLAASQAGALTIDSVVIAVAGTNTPDDTTTNHTHNTSETSILFTGEDVADAVGATTSAKTRYASNLWADAGLLDPEENVITTNSYDMSLSISANPGIEYDVVIESLFQGILVRDDDGSWDKSSAGVSAVEVKINSVVSASHATSAQFLPPHWYDESEVFSEAGTSSMTGLTGNTTLNFNVSWTSNADNTEGDEAAVLLGHDEAGGPVAFVDAGEYGNLTGAGSPGPARDMNLDGHFLTVTAEVTAVPEPSTALLLTIGLVGLAARRRRV